MDEDERDGAVDESGTAPIPSSGAGRGSSRAGGAGIGMAGIPRANRDAMHIAQTLFPSTLCTAFVEVIGLLDDHAVSLDGTGVYEVAYQVRYFDREWGSKIDDPGVYICLCVKGFSIGQVNNFENTYSINARRRV